MATGEEHKGLLAIGKPPDISFSLLAEKAEQSGRERSDSIVNEFLGCWSRPTATSCKVEQHFSVKQGIM